jgi:hypothetical protein
MKQTQNEKLLEYLKAHPEGITPLEALNVIGTFRLAARVYDLRKLGHNIVEKDEVVSGGARVARYRLEWMPDTWVTR